MTELPWSKHRNSSWDNSPRKMDEKKKKRERVQLNWSEHRTLRWPVAVADCMNTVCRVCVCTVYRYTVQLNLTSLVLSPSLGSKREEISSTMPGSSLIRPYNIQSTRLSILTQRNDKPVWICTLKMRVFVMPLIIRAWNRTDESILTKWNECARIVSWYEKWRFKIQYGDAFQVRSTAFLCANQEPWSNLKIRNYFRWCKHWTLRSLLHAFFAYRDTWFHNSAIRHIDRFNSDHIIATHFTHSSQRTEFIIFAATCPQPCASRHRKILWSSWTWRSSAVAMPMHNSFHV